MGNDEPHRSRPLLRPRARAPPTAAADLIRSPRRESMKRLSHLATLTALALAFATSMPVSALRSPIPAGAPAVAAAAISVRKAPAEGAPAIRSSSLRRCPGAVMPRAKRRQRERRRPPRGRGRQPRGETKKSARDERRKQLNLTRKASAECLRRRPPRPARSDRSAKPRVMHEREIRLLRRTSRRNAGPARRSFETKSTYGTADGDAGRDGSAVVPARRVVEVAMIKLAALWFALLATPAMASRPA